WEAFDTSKAWDLTSGDGEKTVYARFRDAVDNASSTYNDTIILDSTLPTGSISINGGASATNSANVTLTLACDDATSGCSQMQFSNDNATWSDWEAYGTSKAWDLTSGDGEKTVYARFRDSAGNISTTYTDTILLDTTVPTGTIIINGGATYTTSTSVTLTLTCADTGSGCADVSFNNDGGAWDPWVTYSGTKTWTLALTDGTRTVEARFRDAGGNISTTYNDTIILDSTPPTGTIIINSDAANTTSVYVALTLTCADTTSGCTEMRFSNSADDSSWSSWETYATDKVWTLSSGDGVKTVYVQFKDLAGNASSSFTDDIILNSTAPTGSIIINNDDTYTTTTSTTLTLTCVGIVSDCATMRFSNDTITWSSWETYATSRPLWTLTPGDDTKTVYAQFKDSAGNISTTYNDTIILDSTAPTGTIIIDGGALYATTIGVTLTLTCADTYSGCDEMKFSNDGVAWSGWEPYSTSKSWLLPASDGTRTVYVQFRDLLDNTSGSFTDGIILDLTAPTGSVTIDEGATTTTTAVGLTLTCDDPTSGCSQMRFSNDDATWSDWEAYGTSKAWTLAADDGTKTVYAQFRDSAGNESDSYSDTIIYDTTAPTGSVIINDDDTYTASTSVTLTLACADATSGCAEMRLTNDGDPWSGWEAYSTSKAWVLNGDDNLHIVYVEFKDAAGNISGTYSDYIYLDTTAPTGSVTIDSGATYATMTAVDLTLTCADATSGCSEMRLSNNGMDWPFGWEAYSTSRAWVLTIGDGTKTVYAQFRDVAGNASGSYTDTIILDTTVPTGTVSINGGATYTNSTSVTLTLGCSDAGSGCSWMRFSNDGAIWSDWEAYSTSRLAWILTSGDGLQTVYAEFRDAAGNDSSTYNDTITLDTTAPTGSVIIDSNATYTASTSVTLALTCADATSGCSEMRFSNSTDFSGSSWEAYSTSRLAWILTSGDGTKTVYAQFRDALNNASGSYTDTIILDTTAPTGSTTINGGATYTTSTSVGLTLTCADALSGCNEMRFSNDGAVWSSWQAYGTSKTWALTSGDGAKTVYTQFKDTAGNASELFYSDDITLDSTAPTGSTLINSGATYTTSTSVGLTLTCADAISGCSQMRFSNSTDFSGSSWEAFGTSKTWDLTSGDGTKTVYTQFKDVAGNESASFTDTIIYDSTAPTGTISINGGAAYTISPVVTLTLGCSDATSGCNEMRFSNDNAAWSSWETYSTTKSWTVSLGDGPKTVYVQFKDTAGNGSGSYSDGITLDSIAPTGTVIINGGAGTTNSTFVTLTLTCADTYSGCSEMKFSNDDITWSSWEPYSTSKTWTLTSGTGRKIVSVRFKDAIGNASGSYSDAIEYVQTRFEDTDSAVTYTGTWTNYPCSACSAGNIKYSKQVGKKATFTFTGKGVKWYATKAKVLGKAKVYIDGALQTTVDLYNATSQAQQVVYTKTWPISGSHTIVVEVTGTKNASATDTYINIDAFEITP
ncbi:MAG: hypothetical protein HY880_01825, partial [Deltaproteobacteria bacterium]|nr:hypothetical protein [Deltaproteobacteria bacterium]